MSLRIQVCSRPLFALAWGRNGRPIGRACVSLSGVRSVDD
jgi:hypothetical protein